MKKYFVTALVFFLASTAAFAQKKHKRTSNPSPTDSLAASKTATPIPITTAPTSQTPPKKGRDWSKIDLSKRSADHFMFELGYDNWANPPDSANIKGFNHSFNFYFMYDFPFKTDARLSVGAGIGIGSSNIFFAGTYPQVAAYQNQTLSFAATSDGNYYKKFKLVTTYLEIPIELRFAADPEHMDKSWKFAVGTKIGLMLSAYTKGTTIVSSNGQVLGNVSVKESSKQFFSGPKFEPTVRISKGFIGVYGQFQINSLLKAGAGQTVLPYAFGIVLSGL